MITAPYYQTNIENTKRDSAFRTIQGAMAWMLKHPNVTGTIYFIPSNDSQIAYVAMRYENGEVTEQGFR